MDYKEFIEEAHEYQKGKACSVCKEHKPLSEFCKNKHRKDGINYICRYCTKEYKDNICPFKRWYHSKKKDGKRKGIDFTIEPTDIPGVKIEEVITIATSGQKYISWEGVEYPKVCSKRGIELDWGMNGIQYNSPSLDRIDPTKGYIPGNVRLVCNSYNMGKGTCPPNEWDVLEKQMARFVLFGNN